MQFKLYCDVTKDQNRRKECLISKKKCTFTNFGVGVQKFARE